MKFRALGAVAVAATLAFSVAACGSDDSSSSSGSGGGTATPECGPQGDLVFANANAAAGAHGWATLMTEFGASDDAWSGTREIRVGVDGIDTARTYGRKIAPALIG